MIKVNKIEVKVEVYLMRKIGCLDDPHGPLVPVDEDQLDGIILALGLRRARPNLNIMIGRETPGL